MGEAGQGKISDQLKFLWRIHASPTEPFQKARAPHVKQSNLGVSPPLFDLENKMHRRGSLSSYLKRRANVSLFPFLCEFSFQTQCRCIQPKALCPLEVLAVSGSKFRASSGHRLLFPVQCSDFAMKCHPYL